MPVVVRRWADGRTTDTNRLTGVNILYLYAIVNYYLLFNGKQLNARDA